MVLEKLRPIMPLKTERVKLQIRVPAQYAGQALGALKSFGEILKEEWGGDGGLSAIIEISAASQPSLSKDWGSRQGVGAGDIGEIIARNSKEAGNPWGRDSQW